MAEIAVIVPVLARPQNARPLAESLAAATTVDHRLVFVCSPTDAAQIAACVTTDAWVLTADWQPGPGDFARKINWASSRTSEPWLFQAADDVRFEPGWDTALLACAEATGALVVGSNDCRNPTVRAGRHATHILFARSYIEDPGASMDGKGTVFSEAYGHQYVDTEAVELAQRRGVWTFCEDSHVVHEHPFWNRSVEKDATYVKGLASSAQDARIYRQRRRLWLRVVV